MNRLLFGMVALLGATAIAWMGASFIGGNPLALAVTLVIGAAYALGIIELLRYRAATAGLEQALGGTRAGQAPEDWLAGLHPSLRHAARLRIEGEREALPGPVLTPYLVGLLVMLGLLGTFFGLVDTLSGAVTALEGSTDLEAIRAGLSAPIAGLGVAFGTSVAGIAASAMLGLGATLSRRDRLIASRELDATVRRVFPEHSVAFRRERAFEAMRGQSDALPGVVERLDTLTDKLARMGSDLSDTLERNQAQFHEAAARDYRELADAVGATLRESLAESGRRAGEGIRPVVEAAMERFNAGTEATSARLAQTSSEHLAGVAAQLEDKVRDLQEIVSGNAREQARLNAGVVEQLTRTLAENAGELAAVSREQSAGVSAEVSRLLGDVGELLQARVDGEQRWLEQHDERMVAMSAAVSTELQALRSAEEQRGDAAVARLGELGETLATSLERLRVAEEQRADAAVDRLSQLGDSLVTKLEQLHTSQEQRAGEAVARLEALEKTAAEHLAGLGRELEAPMTRLIETASETPRAAAEVIARLREELSNSIARDNQLLEERQEVLERLHALTEALEQASTGQRDAVTAMVDDCAGALGQLGERFGEQVEAGVERLATLAGDVSGSATEVASLGEAFQAAVGQFGESNQALVASLERVEQALEQSGARSNEQLGYYVAQAREIIDHSVLSQKAFIDELRQLGRQEALFEAEEA